MPWVMIRVARLRAKEPATRERMQRGPEISSDHLWSGRVWLTHATYNRPRSYAAGIWHNAGSEESIWGPPDTTSRTRSCPQQKRTDCHGTVGAESSSSGRRRRIGESLEVRYQSCVRGFDLGVVPHSKASKTKAVMSSFQAAAPRSHDVNSCSVTSACDASPFWISLPSSC